MVRKYSFHFFYTVRFTMNSYYLYLQVVCKLHLRLLNYIQELVHLTIRVTKSRQIIERCSYREWSLV